MAELYSNIKLANTIWLCDSIDQENKELKDRGWQYIKEIGYDVFNKGANDILIEWKKRNGKTILHIIATFEANFKSENLDFEIPAVVFDATIKKGEIKL